MSQPSKSLDPAGNPTSRFLIAGNWKMNGLKGDGLVLAKDLAERARSGLPAGVEVALFPPATLIASVAEAVVGSLVGVGGQDCHAEAKGAFTGDVSAAMLADGGCRYAIVGHSERRAGHNETDAQVNAKAAAAHAAGLTAIVCVGETAAERDRGAAVRRVTGQIEGSIPGSANAANTAIAYEPVWAIGTGHTAEIGDIAEIHAAIGEALTRLGGGRLGGLRVLYGGSVTPENAAAILATAGVRGALVGGASLDAERFWRIVCSCPPSQAASNALKSAASRRG